MAERRPTGLDAAFWVKHIHDAAAAGQVDQVGHLLHGARRSETKGDELEGIRSLGLCLRLRDLFDSETTQLGDLGLRRPDTQPDGENLRGFLRGIYFSHVRQFADDLTQYPTTFDHRYSAVTNAYESQVISAQFIVKYLETPEFRPGVLKTLVDQTYPEAETVISRTKTLKGAVGLNLNELAEAYQAYYERKTDIHELQQTADANFGAAEDYLVLGSRELLAAALNTAPEPSE